MKNKLTITIETRRQSAIRKRAPTEILWCDLCAAETQMLAPDEAARRGATTLRKIFRAIENGALHFIETNAGSLFVCSNSLGERKKLGE